MAFFIFNNIQYIISISKLHVVYRFGVNKFQLILSNLPSDTKLKLIFKLIPPIKFIKGDFDTKSFVKLKDIITYKENLSNIEKSQEEPTKDITIIDSAFMYCEVLWFDNKTKWQIKGLMLDGI